jgi:protein-tyrosine-phosphatase
MTTNPTTGPQHRITDYDANPVAVQVLAERGISLTVAYPKPLTNDVVHAADLIVTMGCGDACPIYPGKRYLDWESPTGTANRSSGCATSATTCKPASAPCCVT